MSNITRLSTLSKALMLAILCFTVATVPVAAKKKGKKAGVENTFSAPDFAYPKTVAGNARKVMADVNADAIDKLGAAVQLTIADNIVEHSSVKARCASLDSLANALQFPYNNLAYLLEATLYSDIYNSARWKFSQRHLPLSDFPDDPMEWSADMYAVKVMELVRKATDNLEGLQKINISEIEPLLDKPVAKCSGELPTVAAFVVSNSMSLLLYFDSPGDKMLPFGTDDCTVDVGSRVKALRADLFERIVKLTRDAGQIEAAVGFMIRYGKMFNDDSYHYFLDNYKSMGMSSETLPLLLAASDAGYVNYDVRDVDKIKAERDTEVYKLLKEAETQLSGSRYYGRLEREICQYETKNVEVKVSTRYLSSDSIKVSLKSDNINKVVLHLYRIPQNMRDIDVDNVMKHGELVRKMTADVPGEVPFKGTATVVFPPQRVGRYAVLASEGESAASIPTSLRNQYVAKFIVCDIQTVESQCREKSRESRLYVVDGASFAPLKDAKVTFKAYDDKKKPLTAYSNNEGYVDIPEGSYSYTVEYGKNYLAGRSYLYVNENKREYEDTRCEVFTDLSLYHPGDTVNFAAVLYKLKERSISLSPGRKLRIELRDANNQVLDTLDCVSDNEARFNGHFVLPAGNKMLGQYEISVYEDSDFVGIASFEVAEYKTPTFFVELGDIKDEYQVGDVVTISGKAQTYSGMPVANADVNYNIQYISWWVVTDRSYSPFGATVTTDADGKFEIRIPTEKLKSTPYARGAYLVNASVVSPAGETQSAAPLRFMLGKAYDIDTSAIPAVIALTSNQIELNIPVINALGNNVQHTVVYSFERDGKSVLQGSGVSPAISVDTEKLMPGKYNLVITADSLTTRTVPVILYSPDDVVPPYKAVLWVPETNIVAANGQTSVEVKYGSSFKGNKILCEVYDCDGFVSRRWIDATGRIETVKVDVPAADNRVFVRFGAMNNLDYQTQTVSILPAATRNNLKIKVNTFRDKITPGSKEKWSFTLLYNDGAARAMPMMAVMTDKALNSIAPFAWSLNPRESISYRPNVSFSGVEIIGEYASYLLSVCNSTSNGLLPVPEWNFYGFSLFPSAISISRSYAQQKNSANPTSSRAKKMRSYEAANDAVVEEMSVDSEVMMATGAVNESKNVMADKGPALDDIEMSEPQHPLAFFYPSLTTDEAGNVEISFVAPAYSTTWQLQLLGYTPELYSAVAKYDAVSAKPVMVKANLPRFLRTGDNVKLTATLMNNSGQSCPVSGVAEIFNPATDDVIKRADFAAQTLDSGESRVVAIDFDTPGDMTLAGVRFYAISDDYSDGEQSLVAVLPSSSPIIESKQFYLDANTKAFETKVPEIDADATVTLEYCDNPVWYTLTSLPSIAEPKTKSALQKANALYGSVLADEIARRFPQARTAVSYWKKGLETGADSTLVSNLSKNASLKSTALDYTPWVNDAAAETARMQQLDRLLDNKRSQAIIAQLSDDLEKLQKPNGGWSWVPNMESSLFITMSVLERVSMLQRLGCPDLPLDKNVIAKAVNYCDNELYDSYIKSKRKINTGSAVRWLYIRNVLAGESGKGNIRSYHAALLKKVIDDWRSLDIYGKAQAAVVLNDTRHNTVAERVVESLRQYAVNKPGQGMYYDNIGSGFNGMSRLLTTAKVLEAFSAVAPSSECVADLRQWLILQRQTLDWGNGNSTPEVVLAILSSGVNWLDAASSPDIRIDGKPVNATADRYTGNLTLTLTPEQVCGKTVSITRDASGPAWGGVISQYVAPIESVTAHASQHLSITKEIYSVDNTSTGTQLTESQLTPGQRVRVVLTISNDTDLQYVAVTDERGATLEPVEQLAEYYVSDGVWIYREPLNDKTLLLIDFLPKGKHIITYDCFVSLCGDFSLGIATAQSLYAPMITAHSAGDSIIVKQDKDRR